MDASLDDIIRTKNIGRGKGGRRGRAGRGGRGGRERRNSDGIQGGVRGGGIHARRRSAPGNFHATRRLSPKQFSQFRGAPVRHTTGGGSYTGKLLVSNLDFGVDDADVKELFAEFGRIKKAAVHHDRSGCSMGTAEVIFDSRENAVKAIKKYNNVPLDGRAMKIQMVSDGVLPSVASRLSQPRGGARVASRGQQDGHRRGSNPARGGRGTGRGGAGRGAKAAPPSKDDLDAEMDAFNARMKTE